MDSLSDACWNLYRRSFCQLRAAFVWEASPHRTDEVFNSTLFAAVLWQKKDKSVVIKFWNDVWCFFPDVWTCLKTCFGKCLKPLSELEPSLIRIQNMDQGLSFHRNRGGMFFLLQVMDFWCFYRHAPRRLCNVQRPTATDNWAAVCFEIYIALRGVLSAWLLGPGFTIPFHWLARWP